MVNGDIPQKEIDDWVNKDRKGAEKPEITDFLRSRFDPTCGKCQDTEASNAARTKCLQCNDANGVERITESTGEAKCICKETNSFMIEDEENGLFKCEKCPEWKPNEENPFWRAPRSIPMMNQCKRCVGEGFNYDDKVDDNKA